MRKLYLFAAMAAMLAACSSDDLTVEKQVAQQNADDGAVLFTAYVNRGTTRAGIPGKLTTNGSSPEISLQTVGFGVFGYYTDGKPYSETSTPNFMYNQKVVYTSNWKYDPVKYWPNEYGTNAESEGQDKLTFFAYAPWVDVIPGTGRINTGEGNQNGANKSLTSGIVGMTSNVTTGDPYVKYYVDFDPDNRVDLCWGVAKTDFASSVDDTKSPNDIKAGAPYIDVTKPKIADRINLDFKHALAALNVQIDADVDVESHETSALNGATKIWVRSVTFEGFAEKGSLNLNAKASGGPLWYELSSTNTRIGSGSVTIYDGRRDGKEGQTNAEASNETPEQLNPEIVQSEAYTTPTLTSLQTVNNLSGVTNAPVNLFACDEKETPIYVIPTDDKLKITIVYDVETYDPNVAGYLSDGATKGSTIQNAITKEILIGGNNVKLEAGKQYQISLHLGMTSVKFEASVTEWGAVSSGDTDLPINARSIYVTPSANTCTAAGGPISITAKDQSNGTVLLNTGADKIMEKTTFNGVTIETTGVTFDWGTPKFTIPANTTLYKKVYALQIKKTIGGKEYPSNIISITQDAASLTYSPAISISAGSTINIATNASSAPIAEGETDPSAHADWTRAEVTITVDGGTPLGRYTGDNPVPEGKFKIAENGEITLGTALTADQTVKIKIKAGDAEEYQSGNITVGS